MVQNVLFIPRCHVHADKDDIFVQTVFFNLRTRILKKIPGGLVMKEKTQFVSCQNKHSYSTRVFFYISLRKICLLGAEFLFESLCLYVCLSHFFLKPYILLLIHFTDIHKIQNLLNLKLRIFCL